MELNKTFIDGLWSKEINVTSFVQTNITPYLGDASFLQGPTERTKHIWNLCLKALEEERANNGVRSLDNATVSTITSHKAGYIDREQELIVGLQTDELLKRAIKPFGGINVVSRACRRTAWTWTRRSGIFSPITARRITTACSTSTPRRFARSVRWAS